MLRARDHVLRAGAGLLHTSRVPGHLSTPVLGPLQDNLLRPTGYGLGLLRLELPCGWSCRDTTANPEVWPLA